jgi:hypothetical protein
MIDEGGHGDLMDWISATSFGGRNPFAAFLLRHGRGFTSDARTFKGRRMMAQNCFRNATLRAHRDESLTYVEGYVWSLIAIHHAWLIDRDGRVIDPTLKAKWLDGEARRPTAYFGVRFNTPFVRRFTVQTERYGRRHSGDLRRDQRICRLQDRANAGAAYRHQYSGAEMTL